VTLTNKKELARLETVPGAIRTSETGWREEDVRRSMAVRDYRVQARDGGWNRLSGAIPRRRDRSRARALRVGHAVSRRSEADAVHAFVALLIRLSGVLPGGSGKIPWAAAGSVRKPLISKSSPAGTPHAVRAMPDVTDRTGPQGAHEVMR
jgi:hypothetical protein